MSKVFLISDTHFGHKNIIKYCNRPFEDVDEMNEKLILWWNEVVAEDDFVVHLGDFCFGKEKAYLKYLSRLRGKVGLVRGNHDNKIGKGAEGFEWILNWSAYGDCFFQHYPPSEKWIPSLQRRVLEEPCFFGHIHDKSHNEQNAFCVSVERINYRPILFEEALERLKSGEQLCQK